jgi:N-acetylglucosamine-6-sulfatase
MRGPTAFAVQITAVAAIAAATTLAACGGSDESTDEERTGGTSPAHVAAPDAPNVVLVLTDDQDRASVEAMPQLRSDVADEGVTFTDAYATVPECCPSRASIFTGQYAHNHGVVSNEPPEGGVNAFDDSNALPVWLQEAGYRTAYVGKYLNGYGWEALGNDPTEIPDGWTDWIAPTNHTEYQMYDYTLNSNGELVEHGDAPSDYQTDVLADNAVRLLKEGATDEAPLFLTVAPVAPHDEGVLEDVDAARNPRPAPRDLGRFQARGLPGGDSFNEADVSDKPRYVAADPRLDADEIAGLTALYRSRLESLLAVDDLVGRLVRTLRDEDELEETLFIYTSDNGYLLGEHRQVGKEKVYEESSGVPLIIRGPGFDPGTVVRRPVGNVDLAPTILDLAGVEAGLTIDGVSLLEREGVASRPGLVLELLSEHSYSGVRTDRYVFAERRRGDTELYDLKRDPHELSNLAERPSHADLRQRLSALAERLSDCSGASCR